MQEPVLSDKCSPRGVRYGTQIKLNYTFSLRWALWMNLKGNVKLIEASTCQSNPNLTEIKSNWVLSTPLCPQVVSAWGTWRGLLSAPETCFQFTAVVESRHTYLALHHHRIHMDTTWTLWSIHTYIKYHALFTATRENLCTSIYTPDHMMYSPQRIKALQAKHNSRETHVSSLHWLKSRQAKHIYKIQSHATKLKV